MSKPLSSIGVLLYGVSLGPQYAQSLSMQEMPPGGPIPVVEGELDFHTFYRDYMCENKPVIFRGALNTSRKSVVLHNFFISKAQG